MTDVPDWRNRRAIDLERQAAKQRRLAAECIGNAEMFEQQAAVMRAAPPEAPKAASEN